MPHRRTQTFTGAVLDSWRVGHQSWQLVLRSRPSRAAAMQPERCVARLAKRRHHLVRSGIHGTQRSNTVCESWCPASVGGRVHRLLGRDFSLHAPRNGRGAPFCPVQYAGGRGGGGGGRGGGGGGGGGGGEDDAQYVRSPVASRQVSSERVERAVRADAESDTFTSTGSTSYDSLSLPRRDAAGSSALGSL
jgi:hypothetical protein